MYHSNSNFAKEGGTDMLDEKPRNQSLNFSNGAHQRNIAMCGRMCGKCGGGGAAVCCCC